jgi:hypothetical protein
LLLTTDLLDPFLSGMVFLLPKNQLGVPLTRCSARTVSTTW